MEWPCIYRVTYRFVDGYGTIFGRRSFERSATLPFVPTRGISIELPLWGSLVLDGRASLFEQEHKALDVRASTWTPGLFRVELEDLVLDPTHEMPLEEAMTKAGWTALPKKKPAQSPPCPNPFAS